jgi:hypothetical protein
VDSKFSNGVASAVDLGLGGKGIIDGIGGIGKTFIFGKDAMELVPQVGMLVTDTALTQYELKGNVGNVMNGIGLPQSNGIGSANSDRGMSSGKVKICSGMGAQKGGCE